jgi:type IX secretion system PorP/SprF family membrane protein
MCCKKIYLFALLIVSQLSFSQEGIAVYSDYLSDNLYLLHPSMAGASNCAKLRVTARKQWFGVEDAPEMQTASFNSKIGERSGAGMILFNDKNGYHSQTGAKFTYAHHIMFSRDNVDLNQLSFGMSLAFIQSRLDETEFLNSFGGAYDPTVNGTIVQKDSYLNFDIGASYNYLEFYAHLTVKNAIETRREIYTEYESDNLRKVIASAGYTFGNQDQLMWEPSLMYQFTEKTKESAIDVNLKVYKQLDFGKLWGGLSYRRSFDGAEYLKDGGLANQKFQSVTPIIGVNVKKFMFSYTYSQIMGDVRFDTGGYHQLTVGFNLFCRDEKFSCNCPAVN